MRKPRSNTPSKTRKSGHLLSSRVVASAAAICLSMRAPAPLDYAEASGAVPEAACASAPRSGHTSFCFF